MPPENSSQPTPTPEQGYEYVVKKGDSLASIVRSFARAGIAVSFDDVFKSNPGLDSRKLRIGQRLFIPAPYQ
jgi:LysM repeat protein